MESSNASLDMEKHKVSGYRHILLRDGYLRSCYIIGAICYFRNLQSFSLSKYINDMTDCSNKLIIKQQKQEKL